MLSCRTDCFIGARADGGLLCRLDDLRSGRNDGLAAGTGGSVRMANMPQNLPARASALEEIIGVDIDGDPDVRLQFWNGSSPGAQIALQIDVARGLDEKAPAVAAAYDGDGSL